jgi:hypothetical protein
MSAARVDAHGHSEDEAPDGGRPPARMLKRVVLSAAIAIVSLNVWTGSPLLALWIGSRVQGSGPPTMAAVFVVALVLLVLSLVLVRVLALLGAAYDDVTGQRPSVRAHTPWLRSMRGEREQYKDVPARLTTLERTVVAMVVIAVALFEVWFFFFSSSPIDQRSGRSALPPSPAAAIAARA